VVNATPRPPYPQGGQPVPIVQEAGKVPRPVWTDAENLSPAGARTPNRPTHSDYATPALSDALEKAYCLPERQLQIVNNGYHMPMKVSLA